MNFREKCYDLLSKVPKGKVTTYKSIAESLGTKAYRAVGTAMNKNPHNTEIVPCHRVIKSNGEVGDYAHGISKKVQRLKSEGIAVKNGKINLNIFEFKFNQK